MPENRSQPTGDRGPVWVRHPEQLRLVYVAGYWDGPLSGMAVLDGQRAWFQMLNADEWTLRIYGLWHLDDEQLAVEERRHQGFCAQVGSHWNVIYDPDGLRRYSPRWPDGQANPAWRDWYDNPERDKPPQVSGEPFALFMLSPCHGRRARSQRYWARRLSRAAA